MFFLGDVFFWWKSRDWPIKVEFLFLGDVLFFKSRDRSPPPSLWVPMAEVIKGHLSRALQLYSFIALGAAARGTGERGTGHSLRAV